MTPRDREILCWINRFGAVTIAQIAREWFGAPGAPDGGPAARRRIGLLHGGKLLKRERLLWQVSAIVTCTRAGVSAASSPFEPYIPRLFDLEHNLLVVDLAGELQRLHPEAAWITERELRAGKFHLATRSREYAHMPDGILAGPQGRRVAVEVDRTPKSSARYGNLVSDYLDAIAKGQFSSVVWTVASRATANRIEAAILDERASDVASVVVWSGGSFRW